MEGMSCKGSRNYPQTGTSCEGVGAAIAGAHCSVSFFAIVYIASVDAFQLLEVAFLWF
jgi:hypothetical protein